MMICYLCLSLLFLGFNVFSFDEVFEKQVFKVRDSVSYNTGTSFEKFLCWTNEKEKISQAVVDHIGKKRGSLLDIGAGNGEISSLLSPNFDVISAVEPSLQLFDILKGKCNFGKYQLINLPFEEIEIKNKFDVILASHSFQYVSNPHKHIYKIKNLLNDFGVFLLINLKRDCGYWKLYNTYRKDILGESSVCPYNFDYDLMNFLERVFKVEKVFFDVTVTVPSVDDLISLFDFFYDIEFSKIKKETLIKIKKDLVNQYGDGVINLDFEQVMYICRK